MMMLHDKLWIIKQNNSKMIQNFVTSLGINKVIANILINRGIESIEEAKEFLYKGILSPIDNTIKKPINTLEIDMVLSSPDISFELIDELKVLEPFDENNPKPLFVYKNLTIESLEYIGVDRNQLKMIVQAQNRVFDCIGFNFNENNMKLSKGQKVDLAFTLEKNNFKGIETIQFVLEDIRRLHSVFYESEEIMKDFYGSFNNLFDYSKNQYKNSDARIDSKLFDKRNLKNRLDFIIKHIDSNDSNLVLINNPDSLVELLFELSDRNRIDLANKISFNKLKDKSNIVINPILSSINLLNYDNVYLYDMPLSSERLHQVYRESKNLYLLYNRADIKKIETFLEKVIPSRDDLVNVYKFLLKSTEIREYETLYLCNNITNMNISKLEFSLDILKSAKLISIEKSEKKLDIDLLPTPEKKLNITSTELYKKLSSIKTDFKEFKVDAFKDIDKLFKEDF